MAKTKQTFPQALIIWDPAGIRFELLNTESIPLSQVERAGFLLGVEMMRQRQGLASKRQADERHAEQEATQPTEPTETA